MRIMVFFDLPTTDCDKRKEYTHFRAFLIRDGYDMLQFSVYSRLIGGYDMLDKHLGRLRKNLPPEGHVRYLILTEKQFTQMVLLVGEKTHQEKIVNEQQCLFI
jgi:CRISPR-associated protein Cas2